MRGGGGGAAGISEEDKLDAGAAKQVLRRAWRMLRPYRRLVITGAVLSVLWTGTIVAGPFLVRYGIDQGLRQDDEGALNLAVACFVGVTALSYVSYRSLIIAVNLVGENFLRDLRVRVFDHLQALSMAFFDREKAGVIVSRMTPTSSRSPSSCRSGSSCS
jgi:ATP-binding cassette subfamily B protein